jgi:UDP-N-acetylglucosamine--N-acetylmuramyl-(pentapeptide) pyrophosphoryl-undecaprenol N-acetylglucosamine transferase
VRIVIAGGGTAGHVNPAIAVARSLRGHDVSFVGTARGAEATLVPAAGFELEEVDVRGFDRARPLSFVPIAARAADAFRCARRMLRHRSPRVVLGMGGYVSLPVCAAARTLGVPVVVHEQNIVLGLANRVSKRFARRVAVSFEETLAAAGPRGVFTGNPVLPEVAGADRAEERSRGLERFDLHAGRKTLLVFGGSQGARRINEAAVGLVDEWNERSDRQVLHISGPSDYEAVSRRVADSRGSSRLTYRVAGFVDRMVEAYAVADLSVCRGGATTIAELTVTGVPSIIVPYPYHRDRQQQRQGEVLERAGAAVVVSDADATTVRISREADRILDDDEALTRMRKCALATARPDAAQHLAGLLEEVAG